MGWRQVAPASRSGRVAMAFALVLLPASAMADRHIADFGGGRSRGNGSALDGIAFSAEVIPAQAKRTPRTWTFGIALDASQVAGKHDFPGEVPGQSVQRELSRTTILGGLRATLSTGKMKRNFQPFVHLLGGGAYERPAGLDPGWSAAWTFGGGLDIVPFLESLPWLVVRGQYDRRHVGGSDPGWYDQWSYGIVFRVEPPKP